MSNKRKALLRAKAVRKARNIRRNNTPAAVKREREMLAAITAMALRSAVYD